MLNSKRFLFILSIISLSFALMACTPTNSVDPTQEMLTDDDVIDTEDDMDTDVMMSEASDTSDYAGVILTLNDVINEVVGDGAAAGTLQLNITLENTTDETITLPFATEDYILTDPNGLNIVPTVISDELLDVELESGASVTGELDYAVVDPQASHIFSLGDFENIAINPVAES